MSERNKKSRWAKSLNEAGLMDPIEDAWEMPNDPEKEAISVNPKNVIPSTPPRPESDPASEVKDSGIHIPDSKGHDDTTRRVTLDRSKDSHADPSDQEAGLEFDGFETLDEESREIPGEPEETEVPFAIPIPTVPPPPETTQESGGQISLEPENASLPPALREATISSTPPSTDSRATANLFHDALTQLKEAKRQRLRADIALDEFHERNSASPQIEVGQGTQPNRLTDQPFDQQHQRNIVSQAPERSTPKLEYAPPPTDSFAPVNIQRRIAAPSSQQKPIQTALETPHEEMQKKFDLGDYTGALEVAQRIISASPDDEEAAHIREVSREVLLQMYESRIGAMDKCPTPAIMQDEIIWKNLDPSSGFILSQIDGTVSFEDILDISGMPRLETCKILSKLLEEGIIK